ncbi:hypothetical protein BD289DRAFT_268192 [Coniella lustricola]|uniref:Uncharacterized protein n=1 Tax=Coniella lustricola TaxID=2025994 RepID=A0A2T3A745_9PEZI|nr:hypothetical protein BD289DRAFT_268192 [Coniella lustricola]
MATRSASCLAAGATNGLSVCKRVGIACPCLQCSLQTSCPLLWAFLFGVTFRVRLTAPQYAETHTPFCLALFSPKRWTEVCIVERVWQNPESCLFLLFLLFSFPDAKAKAREAVSQMFACSIPTSTIVHDLVNIVVEGGRKVMGVEERGYSLALQATAHSWSTRQPSNSPILNPQLHNSGLGHLIAHLYYWVTSIALGYPFRRRSCGWTSAASVPRPEIWLRLNKTSTESASFSPV